MEILSWLLGCYSEFYEYFRG